MHCKIFPKNICKHRLKELLPFHKLVPPADIIASAHRTVSSLYSRRLTRRTSILSFLQSAEKDQMHPILFLVTSF